MVGGGSGRGRTSGRRTNKVQGGSNGGRSQRGDRRDLEQEEPGETQAAAMTVAHGGADGGRSHGGGRADDSRGPTDGGGAGGARGGGGETKIQIRRAKAEPKALATEAEAAIR
ncbi:hypothetical protein M9458_053984, partial [Cirrhinus mrigala]